jgi:hypothetical protein
MERLRELMDRDTTVALMGRAAMKAAVARPPHYIDGSTVDEYFDTSIVRLNQRFPRKTPVRRDPEHVAEVRRRSFVATGQPGRSFQIDVMDLGGTEAENRYVLLIVDVQSRKAWCFALGRTHTMDQILEKWKRFVDDVLRLPQPQRIGEEEPQVIIMAEVSGDDDFSAKRFTRYNRNRGIAVHHDYAKYDHISPGGDRLGVLDRVTQTLKTKVKLYRASFGRRLNERFQEILDDLTASYNTSLHRTLLERCVSRQTVRGACMREGSYTPDYYWALGKENASSELAWRAQQQQHNAAARDDMILRHPGLQPGRAVRHLQVDGKVMDKVARKSWQPLDGGTTAVYEILGLEGYKYRIIHKEKGIKKKQRFRPKELQLLPQSLLDAAKAAHAEQETQRRQQATAARNIRERQGIDGVGLDDVIQAVASRGQASRRPVTRGLTQPREQPPPPPREVLPRVEAQTSKRRRMAAEEIDPDGCEMVQDLKVNEYVAYLIRDDPVAFEFPPTAGIDGFKVCIARVTKIRSATNAKTFVSFKGVYAQPDGTGVHALTAGVPFVFADQPETNAVTLDYKSVLAVYLEDVDLVLDQDQVDEIIERARFVTGQQRQASSLVTDKPSSRGLPPGADDPDAIDSQGVDHLRNLKANEFVVALTSKQQHKDPAAIAIPGTGGQEKLFIAKVTKILSNDAVRRRGHKLTMMARFVKPTMPETLKCGKPYSVGQSQTQKPEKFMLDYKSVLAVYLPDADGGDTVTLNRANVREIFERVQRIKDLSDLDVGGALVESECTGETSSGGGRRVLKQGRKSPALRTADTI